MIIDFDANDWMGPLGDALRHSVPCSRRNSLLDLHFSSYEEALKELVDAPSVDQVVDDVLAWVKEQSFRVYHGTRLTDEEVKNLQRTGMIPLSISKRVDWLRATFPQAANILTPQKVQEATTRGHLQYRENQVHAALSKKEMLSGYEYLYEGSEFDRRLLEYAGRPDFVELLKKRGTPRIVRLMIPGSETLDAMHHIVPIEQVRAANQYPNLVREMLRAWAWQLHKPGSERHPEDSCLVFERALPSSYIEGVDEISS